MLAPGPTGLDPAMANVTIFCFLASYLVALVLECFRFVRRTAVSRAFALVATAAGLVAHTFYLVEQSRQAGLNPLLSSTRDWLLVLAWLAIALYLFVSLLNPKLDLGPFLLPMVLILVAASYFVSATANPVVAPDAEAHRLAIHRWAMLHASLLVIGIVCVLLGFVMSLMYLVQHRRLKQKQATQSGLALPSLEKLARMNWWAVSLSLPLLVLGMLTGIGLAIFTMEGDLPRSLLDPVVLGNGLVWLAMIALFIWLRATKRSAAKQVAWLTVWAFGLLLATLVGLEVFTGGHFSSPNQAGRQSSGRSIGS